MASTLIAIALAASLAGASSDISAERPAALSAERSAADGFQEGLKAYEDMDLDGAAESLTRALRSSSSKERPRIELWLGIVELERGNETTAKRWLRSALKASPRLTVKQELSPKIVATIDSIRDSVRTKKSASGSAPPASSTAAPVAVVAPAAVPPVVNPPVVTAPAPVATAPVAAAAVVSASVTPFATRAASAPVALATAPVQPTPSVSPPSAQVATATPSALPVTSSTEPSSIVEGDIGASPILLASAAAGALAVASMGGAAAFGVIATIGGSDAQQEERAALATKRYEDATTAAAIANGLYVAGGLAFVVGAVCGGIWLAAGDES